MSSCTEFNGLCQQDIKNRNVSYLIVNCIYKNSTVTCMHVSFHTIGRNGVLNGGLASSIFNVDKFSYPKLPYSLTLLWEITVLNIVASVNIILLCGHVGPSSDTVNCNSI